LDCSINLSKIGRVSTSGRNLKPAAGQPKKAEIINDQWNQQTSFQEEKDQDKGSQGKQKIGI
jgi:hypothetical protein